MTVPAGLGPNPAVKLDHPTKEGWEMRVSRKRLATLVGGLFITCVLAAVVGYTAGTANAGTVVSPVEYTSSSFTSVVTASSVAASSAKGGKIQLHWQSPKAKRIKGKCPVIQKWSQRRGLKCFRAGRGLKGKHFSNSGVNTITGARTYFNDYVGSKYTPVGTAFYWDAAHHTWRKEPCTNYVSFTSLPRLSVRHILLTRFPVYTATATATATAKTLGSATASCSITLSDGITLTASGTVYAWGAASGQATATAKAGSKKKALTQVNAKAVRLANGDKQSLTASAKANANAGVSGQATAYCSAVTVPPPPGQCPKGWTGTYPNCVPPPPPPPPPPPAPPSCNNVTTPQNGPNGIYVDGETYPGTVDVFAKNGDSLTVSFGANLGSGYFSSPSTFTSSGTDSPNWVYVSPTDAGDAGLYDQITITVHDNTTGLTGSCQSGQFLLSASPEGGRP